MAPRQESGKSTFCLCLPLAEFEFEFALFGLLGKQGKDTKVKTQEINAARDLLGGRLHREDKDKRKQEKQKEHWKRHERDARESDERSSKRKRKSPFVDDECDVSGDGSGDDSGEGEGDGHEGEESPKTKEYVWKKASFDEAVSDWGKHKQAQKEEKTKSKAIYQAFMERQKESQKKPQSVDDTQKKSHYPFTGQMRPVGWNCPCGDCKK